LIDGYQISVRVRVEQNPSGCREHSRPSLAFNRPGLRDLPDDLSRLDVAFFNVNGYIAVILFLAVLAGRFT